MALDDDTNRGPGVSLLTGLDMSHITLCPAIAFNKIVGGRYKLHILCVLHRGPLRFGEIGRSLVKGGLGKPVTPRILSRELKDMTELGLLDRKEYPVVPKKVEYALGPRGKALLPILSEIVRWGATGVHEDMLEVSQSRH
ncbi:winged helix-turn-helix transcriptional regulator [Jannaschia sp. CCS1]|uniref:winged helix-turn-helix transcriptional regulator n=1 Tax=Jannaschia sp. (strain CCS1) TaxID=290400 RepID=UPI000053BBE6|nr:winged helix-turn-helix transcriptional regulator [Jannaschia sp. CCS1]ABD53278.1 putative transcriptional regulator [Jannaschia sp. CCS1]